MTTALTPELAIAYLRELSVDVRAAVVLDASGSLLAGDAEIAAPARELLARTGAGALATGPLRVARASDGRAIAALAGAFALAPVLDRDLATVAQALCGRRSEPPGSSDPPS